MSFSFMLNMLYSLFIMCALRKEKLAQSVAFSRAVKHLFVEIVDQKASCVICREIVAVMKEYKRSI